MQVIKCYDAVSEVLDEASSQFAPSWVEDTEKRNALKLACELIDTYVESFGIIAISTDVDVIEHNISITIECDSIDIEAKDKFLDLMKGTIGVLISISEHNLLDITLDFPTIWVSAT